MDNNTDNKFPVFDFSCKLNNVGLQKMASDSNQEMQIVSGKFEHYNRRTKTMTKVIS